MPNDPGETRRPIRDASRFERTVRVRAADLDELDHVNNVVYLQWIQDIAAAHWASVAPDDLARSVAWVVLRHEIDYRHPAVGGDTVTVRTWVGEARGARWDRHTEVLRESDGKVLASARSVWCPLHAATGRPRRVDDDLLTLFHPGGGEPRPDRS